MTLLCTAAPRGCRRLIVSFADENGRLVLAVPRKSVNRDANAYAYAYAKQRRSYFANLNAQAQNTKPPAKGQSICHYLPLKVKSSFIKYCRFCPPLILLLVRKSRQ